MKLRHIAVLGGLLSGVFFGLIPVTLRAAEAAKQAKPAISEEASAALLRGKPRIQRVFQEITWPVQTANTQPSRI